MHRQNSSNYAFLHWSAECADLPRGYFPKGRHLKLVTHLTVLLMAGAVFASAENLPDTPSAARDVENPLMAVAVVSPVKPVTEAPKPARIFDKKFLALAAVSTASTFADSYTTLFATQNWRAGKTNVCNMETESAFLYGTHPTPGRAYTVAAVKSAGTIALSYYLRKHHRKFWSIPLFANTALSLQGVSRNMVLCN